MSRSRYLFLVHLRKPSADATKQRRTCFRLADLSLTQSKRLIEKQPLLTRAAILIVGEIVSNARIDSRYGIVDQLQSQKRQHDNALPNSRGLHRSMCRS